MSFLDQSHLMFCASKPEVTWGAYTSAKSFSVFCSGFSSFFGHKFCHWSVWTQSVNTWKTSKLQCLQNGLQKLHTMLVSIIPMGACAARSLVGVSLNKLWHLFVGTQHHWSDIEKPTKNTYWHTIGYTVKCQFHVSFKPQPYCRNSGFQGVASNNMPSLSLVHHPGTSASQNKLRLPRSLEKNLTIIWKYYIGCCCCCWWWCHYIQIR